jgi:putative ABC transport system substrate-binding protein
MPAIRRVGELVVSANPLDRIRRTEDVTDFGMQTLFIEVAQAADMEKAVAEAARRGAQVLHVSPEPLLGENLPLILRAARAHSLPILVDGSSWLDNDGVLLSYGPDDLELNRQAAAVIDKVLRGARPADLPIQQPRKFEIGINLKTAKAYAIPVPPSLLLRADVVIR